MSNAGKVAAKIGITTLIILLLAGAGWFWFKFYFVFAEYKGALPWRGMSKFVVDSIISTKSVTNTDFPLDVPIY